MLLFLKIKKFPINGLGNSLYRTIGANYCQNQQKFLVATYNRCSYIYSHAGINVDYELNRLPKLIKLLINCLKIAREVDNYTHTIYLHAFI